MRHLIVSVSLDSSLELLATYADIILLDDGPNPELSSAYESAYIRSHFSHAGLMPQNFRLEIDSLVKQARQLNPAVTFIDQMDTVDEIVTFEDKWHQYERFSDFMPQTKLLSESETFNFKKPTYKNRLSSRSSSITRVQPSAGYNSNEWIVQESIDIAEELRIYIIKGSVYMVGAIRSSMTSDKKTRAVDSRNLHDDEVAFASAIASNAPGLDLLGLDIAKDHAGKLYLIEANRSPGFAAFEQLTHVNLAGILYGDTK